MKEATVMATDDLLVITYKDDERDPPPNQIYKVLERLLPQRSEFIQDLLKKKFIESVPHGKGGRAWYSPVLILNEPNGKWYRFVADLRQLCSQDTGYSRVRFVGAVILSVQPPDSYS